MRPRPIGPTVAALLGFLAVALPGRAARADDDDCIQAPRWQGTQVRVESVASASDHLLVRTGTGVHVVPGDGGPPLAILAARDLDARWIGADTRFVGLVSTTSEFALRPLTLDGELGAAVPLAPLDPARRPAAYGGGEGAAAVAWADPALGLIEVRVLLADDRLVTHAIDEADPATRAVAIADGVAWVLWSRGAALDVRAVRIALDDGRLLDATPIALGADGVELQPVSLTSGVRLYVTGRDRAVRTMMLAADGSVASGPPIARAVTHRLAALAVDRVVHLDPARAVDDFPISGTTTLTLDPGDGTLTPLVQLPAISYWIEPHGAGLAVVTTEEQAIDRTGTSEVRVRRISADGVETAALTVEAQDLALLDVPVCASESNACDAGGAAGGLPLVLVGGFALRRRRVRRR